MSLPSQLASNLASRPCHHKRLSIDSQSSTNSVLSHARHFGHGPWSPPRSRKATPESSVEATSQEGSLKSSSRTTSSEFTPPALTQSSSQDDEPISYAIAEIDGRKFEYVKIHPDLVPTGWSNDPSRLQIVPRKFPASEYSLMGSIAVLVSDSDLGAPQFMISAFHKLYFWTPGSDDLLYVTELYSLARILRRMNENFSGLRTKPLQPLSQHSPPHEPLYHSFWFWEVPKGWSQNLSKLRDLQDVVLGCYEYGLPLSVPILVSEGGSGSSGSTEFLLKCGEEYYLFYEISSDLVHIDEPTGLHEILHALDIKLHVDLKTTRVDLLPEFGGPNVIADKDVPEGWSNKFQKADCGDVFYEHGIIARTILLFHNGSLDGTSLCLAEAATDSYYIWNRSSNEIFRIDKADGLQDILDILKNPSRHLSLARIEARRHSHGHETTAKEVSAMKRKD